MRRAVQWVLEVMAAAAMPATAGLPNRKRVQAWLRSNGYRPSALHIKLHERVAARFGIANATTGDHPASERLSGDYSVVTVESVVKFLQSQGWIAREWVVRREPIANDAGGGIRTGAKRGATSERGQGAAAAGDGGSDPARRRPRGRAGGAGQTEPITLVWPSRADDSAAGFVVGETAEAARHARSERW
ncbi:DUF2145 domain-containing protein [Vulcaniibacterium tengchongense]|uniref:DUF2145 domain-containing protein n=1 Tax=Vulcaniibacterium tengchongense TaxID=1273429 RepID=UPI0024110272|nr:DUF2145 domain-containing protein [Vulcaniibacterium tengchongense]